MAWTYRPGTVVRATEEVAYTFPGFLLQHRKVLVLPGMIGVVTKAPGWFQTKHTVRFDTGVEVPVPASAIEKVDQPARSLFAR